MVERTHVNFFNALIPHARERAFLCVITREEIYIGGNYTNASARRIYYKKKKEETHLYISHALKGKKKNGRKERRIEVKKLGKRSERWSNPRRFVCPILDIFRASNSNRTLLYLLFQPFSTIKTYVRSILYRETNKLI